MKLYPSKPCCGADITAETTVQRAYRGNPPVRKDAKKIFHVRGQDRFWHWSDQNVTTKLPQIGTG